MRQFPMLAFMPGGQTDRVGAFSPVVLTRILKRTADEERSGALQVASGPSVKTVHFEHGSVRFAASNIRRDRLGESMLAHEFISQEDYERAVAKMKNDRCRFGEALVSLGRLTEEEVHKELAIQVQRIVLSLFRIPAGMYSFDDAAGGSSLSSALPFSLPVPPLMLKGLRAIEDGKLILSVLPPATTRVRVATDPPRGAPLKKLSEAERSVLHIAGAGTEIGEIVRRSELGRSMAFRSCFILLSLGLLEAIPDDISPAVIASQGDPAPSEPASGDRALQRSHRVAVRQITAGQRARPSRNPGRRDPGAGRGSVRDAEGRVGRGPKSDQGSRSHRQGRCHRAAAGDGLRPGATRAR